MREQEARNVRNGDAGLIQPDIHAAPDIEDQLLDAGLHQRAGTESGKRGRECQYQEHHPKHPLLRLRTRSDTHRPRNQRRGDRRASVSDHPGEGGQGAW